MQKTSEEWKTYLLSIKSEVDDMYRTFMTSKTSSDKFLQDIVIAETYLEVVKSLKERQFPGPFITYLQNHLLDNFGAKHNLITLSKNQKESNSLYYMSPELSKRYYESFFTVKSWIEKLQLDGIIL